MFKNEPNCLGPIRYFSNDRSIATDGMKWLLYKSESKDIVEYIQYLESLALSLLVIFILETVIICALLIRRFFF